ncbi:DUF3696 domain-containing protein [Runella sp.]|uniref:AAA family ATPase n=1 Tax=Runella sp. TaxID=1960881 RepID=UPI003D0A6928
MLIQNLSLKNFKCFEEVDVEFAPITLLTGANSSGKSSLIYSLLAVLQTEQFPFYLSPNGKYVNLGGFEEMVWKGSIEEDLGITLKLKDITISTTWLENSENGLPYIVKCVFEDKDEIQTFNDDGNISIIIKKANQNVKIKHKELEELLDNLTINKSETQVEIHGINTDTTFDTLSPLLSKLIPGDSIYSAITDIEEFFWSIYNNESELPFNYIGSFRQPPERTYYQKAKAQSKVDTDGAGYIDQIIEWEETNPEKLAELAKIMSELELFQEIRSNKFKGGRFELAVKTQKNSEMAALTDVGFGISQFLPIIVADLQLDDHSCLALSQPEIHLHPKIQALFGNFLANQVKRTQKQYIVETHSEYLLNRIRLLLVKGELKPEDVRVYYFENDGIKTTTHKVEFATDGQIKGAPQGFFDTYAIDVMDIAMNSFAD